MSTPQLFKQRNARPFAITLASAPIRTQPAPRVVDRADAGRGHGAADPLRGNAAPRAAISLAATSATSATSAIVAHRTFTAHCTDGTAGTYRTYLATDLTAD